MLGQLFGWDLDSLWQTVNQRRCDVLLRADRVIEAIESYQFVMGMMDDAAKTRCLEWSTGKCSSFRELQRQYLFQRRPAFKRDCIARCIAIGDDAFAASAYKSAIEVYSAAIWLDSSCEFLFAQRSKARSRQHLYAEALADADRVQTLFIMFLPSVLITPMDRSSNSTFPRTLGMN